MRTGNNQGQLPTYHLALGTCPGAQATKLLRAGNAGEKKHIFDVLKEVLVQQETNEQAGSVQRTWCNRGRAQAVTIQRREPKPRSLC